ncbi:MAG: hypothetical protein K8L99_00850 [Anaerolineae bacterium]|nr:hypothetical protein [Anaerolineae bacterium]
MAKQVDRGRKLLVRTALVTSSTIATLIGAQSLALLDNTKIEEILTPIVPPTEGIAVAPSPTTIQDEITNAAPSIEILHESPSLTILRHPGQTGPIQTASSQPRNIQPPNPVQLSAPEPVIVQGEAPPPIIIQQSSGSSSRTRSSR